MQEHGVSIGSPSGVEDAGQRLSVGVVVVEPGCSPSVPAGKPDPKRLPKGYNRAKQTHVHRAKGKDKGRNFINRGGLHDKPAHAPQQTPVKSASAHGQHAHKVSLANMPIG